MTKKIITVATKIKKKIEIETTTIEKIREFQN